MINSYLDELHESHYVLKVFFEFRTYTIRAAKVGEEYACAIFYEDDYLDGYSILIIKDNPLSPVDDVDTIQQLLADMKARLTRTASQRAGF